MREDRASRVNKENAFSELQALHVRIASNHYIDTFPPQRSGHNIVHWSGLGSQLVSHTDAESIGINELCGSQPGVGEDVVVTLRDKDIRKLLAPVEYRGGDHIAPVENEVNVAKSLSSARPELVEAVNQ